MRFGQVQIGQRFRWQGQGFCKTGPLTAHADEGGDQRLIPRSAAVEPIEADQAVSAAPTIPRGTALSALDALGAEIEAAARTLPPAAAEAVRAAWANGRRGFIARIDRRLPGAD
jgi:hypothetical protein